LPCSLDDAEHPLDGQLAQRLVGAARLVFRRCIICLA
jgi:hypothetical protein